MSRDFGSPQATIDAESRVLTFLYGLLALAATARSVYQLIVRVGLGSEAPLPYLLSALAALIYIVACVGFGQRSPRFWRITLVVCGVELAGVLLIGLLSVIDPALFPRSTVWSSFGSGYFYLPLILPAAGVLWLWRQQTRRAYGLHP